VQHFAYPSGIFNTAAVDAVAAAGYRFGYTTCTHRDARFPLLTVPRTLLWENSCLDSHGVFSGSILSCQIHRAFDLVSGCRQRHAASQECEMTGYSVSQIRFTERSRTATGTPASYWLLLAFLFLLYANLPLVMPALDPLHLAKVVGEPRSSR
jgi:hypothetical protein